MSHPPAIEFEVLGYPPDGPTLELDYRQFAYAGKFVMSNTGKSVAKDDGIVGAVAFNADHDDPGTGRLRYVTVREDRRGEGIGSRLLRFTAERLRKEYERVTIAANNPVAYRACYRAGFEFTGRETGIAELLLQYDPESAPGEARYRDGLERFRERDLPAVQRAVLDHRHPPGVVESPPDSGDSD